MSSSTPAAPPSTTDAAANASKRHAAKVEASAGGEAATWGGSAAQLSPKLDDVKPPGETSAKKIGGGTKVDSPNNADGGSGASPEQEKTTAVKMEIGSNDTPKLDRLTRLGLVMSRVEDPFFCEGQVNLHGKKLKLQLLPRASSVSGGASKTAVQELELPSPFFDKFSEHLNTRFFWDLKDIFKVLKDAPLRPEFSKILENVFEPSPFGHGGQTVLDESVRKAMQVEVDRIVSTGVNLEEMGILESVRLGLAPTATRIHASLDKLNLYAGGGHFKSHRDTPRDELAFGTLVVALPSMFVGGDLVVRHRGVKRICQWSTWAGKKGNVHGTGNFLSKFAESPVGILQWCAFYGHCDHEITPVLEGHRLTLTYILRYDPADEGIAQHMAGGMGASAKMSVVAGLDLRSQGSDEDSDEYEEAKDEDGGIDAAILSTATCATLKDECRMRGLKLSGTKDELIARLLGKPGGGSGKQRRRQGLPDVGVYPMALAEKLGTGVLRELKDAVADDAFMEAGGLIGVPCMHLYEQDADLPPLDESVLDGKFIPKEAIKEAGEGPEEGKSVGEDKPPVVRARDLRLKGVDAVVYMCAARLGLRPMVLRIVWDDFSKYSLKEMPSLQTAYNWCFVKVVESSFVARCIAPGFSIEPSATGPCQGGQGYEGRTLSMDDVSWITPAPFGDETGTKAPTATLIPSILMSYNGYFGNCASHTTYYAAAAIVFVVPPANSSGRRTLIANAPRGFGTPAAKREEAHDRPPSPKKAKTDSHAARGEGSGDGQSLSGGTEQDTTCFKGLRRGLAPRQEELAWTKYSTAWKRGKPDMPIAEVVRLADDRGVSTYGSTRDILRRISTSAEQERARDLRMFNGGGDGDDEYLF